MYVLSVSAQFSVHSRSAAQLVLKDCSFFLIFGRISGIWQSDYRRAGWRVEGDGDQRTNLASICKIYIYIHSSLFVPNFKTKFAS
jgi:hypothetical protein